MLDTKRSRGIVIAVVVGVVSIAGLALRVGGEAAYEDERDDFVAAAGAQLADTSGAEAYELWLDGTLEDSTEIDELLSIEGHGPAMITSPRPGEVEAVYRIDAWGRDGRITVRLTDDGLEIEDE